MRQISIGAFVFVLAFQLLFAQNEKRIRRDDLSVDVHATVSKTLDSLLRFRYLFKNSPSSRQKLVGLTVELNDDWPEYGGSLRNVIGPQEKDWGQYPTIVNKMTWVTQYDTTGLDALEWPPLSSVAPGESISFSFEAKGLPGIGSFWAEGWAPWCFSEEERDSLLNEGYPESDLQATEDGFLRGFTIVRVTSPNSILPTQFIDSLSRMITRSFSLNWIRDESTANKYRDYFSAAKVELEQKNVARARGTLQQLLRSAIDDSASSLSSEAYALIQFNTEYLMRLLSIDSLKETAK
jgi:hypothetical protein